MPSDFQTWSPLHFVTLGVCALAVALVPILARSVPTGVLRAAIGWGCLAVWIINTAYWAMPERFAWERSLPLHFCNLANLVGGVALLRRTRFFQGLLYFWALGLSVCAFLTPTVGVGPARAGFWVFWIYHLFIALAAVFLLAVDRFRPRFGDLVAGSVATLAYMIVLVVLNLSCGWNYGFVGPGNPGSPTLLDHLGPYPLRLVWMALLGALIFTVLWLPALVRTDRTN